MKFKDAQFIQGFRFPSHLEHLKNHLPAPADTQADSSAEQGERCSQEESGMQGSDEKDRSAEQNRLKQEEGSSAEQDWEEEEEDKDEDENVAEKDDPFPAALPDLTSEDLTSECESLWWPHSLILQILSQKQYRGKPLSTVHVHDIGLVGLGQLPFKASSKLFWKANEGRFFLLSSDSAYKI